MIELKNEYIDVIESLGWHVSSYTDDGRVEIETGSPAGEDLVLCLDVRSFPDSVKDYYLNFDVDEHVEMWVEAKYNDRDGHLGVPSVRTLVHDAEEIEKMLETMSDALSEVETDDDE